MTTWTDFTDGYWEYLKSEKDMALLDTPQPGGLTIKTGVHAITRLRSTDGEAEDTIYNRHLVKQEWVRFVEQIVRPELVRHQMYFSTMTFKEIVKDEPPTLSQGRKAIEAFLRPLDVLPSAYVIVEERGVVNNRLHYHGLFRLDRFGDSYAGLIQHFQRYWPHGFNKLGLVENTDAVCHYVTKYIVKGEFDASAAWYMKRDIREVQLSF